VNYLKGRFIFLLLASLLFSVGCTSQTNPFLDGGMDASYPDGGSPDGGSPDGGIIKVSSFIITTSGGGTLESDEYRLEIFISPATPAGKGNWSGGKLQLGPAAILSKSGK